VDQEHPGERRERRFARQAEEGTRPGSASDATANAPATTAAPPSTAIESPPAAPGNEAAAAEPEIMTRLPRTRPERRSTRRAGATGQRRRTNAARSASSRKRTPAAKGATTAKQRDRGRREQVTDAAVQTATMPFRATFALARRAGRLIGRLR
jgi:hypothetical protein